LREGRSGDVEGEPFELTAITSNDELLGVYVDAKGFRHGLVGLGGPSARAFWRGGLSHPAPDHEADRGLSGTLAADRRAASR
jgi:hypothetical protein